VVLYLESRSGVADYLGLKETAQKRFRHGVLSTRASVSS